MLLVRMIGEHAGIMGSHLESAISVQNLMKTMKLSKSKVSVRMYYFIDKIHFVSRRSKLLFYVNHVVSL